jgi:serine/threonine protein kinase
MPIPESTRAKRAGAARRQSLASPARTVGRWQLDEPLGQGRLGCVYAARPCGTGDATPASYAVKLLRDEWQGEATLVGLLAREALVGSEVCSPHLVSVLEARVHEAPQFLVMPRLDGTTLESKLSGGYRPTVCEALWIARQAAEALDALHQTGWLHGDVKPGNLMISPEGHVTLIDLGFARCPAEFGSVIDRPLLGTVHYLAPEQITSTAIDIRADIYSLGATLLEMLTGQVPYQADDLMELAKRHRTGEGADLRELAPMLPAQVGELVEAMLSRHPLRRPQTPRELVDHLVSLEIATFAAG